MLIICPLTENIPDGGYSRNVSFTFNLIAMLLSMPRTGKVVPAVMTMRVAQSLFLAYLFVCLFACFVLFCFVSIFCDVLWTIVFLFTHFLLR